MLKNEEGLEAIKKAEALVSATSSGRRAFFHHQRKDHAGWCAATRRRFLEAFNQACGEQ